MNKLVIVGNGFDLAHGLPTSYKDFIDDFWKNLKHTYKLPLIRELVYVNESYYRIFQSPDIMNFKTFEEGLISYANQYAYTYQENTHQLLKTPSEYIFKFESNFFHSINQKRNIENWVDIEKEYYRKLTEYARKKEIYAVKKLNKELEQIKILFENYLIRVIENKYYFNQFEDRGGFYQLTKHFECKHNYINNTPIDNYLEEFPPEDEEEIRNFNEKIKSLDIEDDISTTNLFLSFNYTPFLYCYVNILNQKTYNHSFYGKNLLNYIHGEINSDHFPINFGFGDENDNDYSMIEDLDDNEYLKYFKSFQYLQNDNYDKLLRFIESEKFQVYIMGHSCGLSDRTLLSTIFEHKNCRSIKPFYYEWEEGESELKTKKDNYTELVQNISRHFSDKKQMRKKVVNKNLCRKLSQNIRFVKKGKS